MPDSLIDLLEHRIADRGDLPVFRKSVLEVVRLAEDTQCAASDIARVILQDQGLSVKVLRVANSPFYNRSGNPIKTVSRAVVLLGIEVIRDICLSLGLVELFQKHHPWINLKEILARSYFAAALSKELGMVLKDRRSEEFFLGGLLQYLGPLAVAYYLPEKYLELQQLMEKGEKPPLEAEKRVLGHSFATFGESLAARWSLPAGLFELLVAEPRKSSSPSAVRVSEFSRASRQIAEDLFGNQCGHGGLEQSIERLQEEFEIEPEKLEHSIEKAFSETRKSSRAWGIEASTLEPLDTDSDSVERKEVVGRLLEVQQRDRLPSQVDLLVEDTEEANPSVVQLELLREISLHIFENRDLSTLFDLIMEGIQRVVQFDRMVLSLCNKERTELRGRYGFGLQANEFAGRIRVDLMQENLFTRCLREKKPLLILDSEEEPFASLLGERLRQQFPAPAFAISPIYSSEQQIGLFYADNFLSGRPISREDYRCFEHFTLQANLGIDRMRLRL